MEETLFIRWTEKPFDMRELAKSHTEPPEPRTIKNEEPVVYIWIANYDDSQAKLDKFFTKFWSNKHVCAYFVFGCRSNPCHANIWLDGLCREKKKNPCRIQRRNGKTNEY